MTPDEVVKVLQGKINILKSFYLKFDKSSQKDLDAELITALQSAISILQDYQKLRERVSVEKIVANVPFYQNIMPVERQEIVKQIVTYLQQPTEH